MSRRAQGPVLERFSGNSYRRRGPGSRTIRRQEFERERRRRSRRMVILTWIIATVVIVAITVAQRFITRDKPSESETAAAPETTVATWLLIGTVEADTSGEADWLSVFAHDTKTDEAVSIYLPGSTLVEIPGHGQEALSKSLAFGRVPLQVSTVSNVLGIGFDHYLRISDQSIRAFVEKIGGVEIDIHARLTETDPEGRVRTIFAEGKQVLSGERASEYIRYRDPGEDEISRATRHANFWSGLLLKFRASDDAALGKELESSKELFETDAEPAQLAEFFNQIEAISDTKLTMQTLPVKAIGVDTGKQFYAVDRPALEQMIDRYLKSARPAGAARTGRRIEILNGNGRPGIGQQVADQLIPKGFRIILNQNAKRFDYETTQIVVYSGSKAALATAEEIRSTLGVGEVLISRQSQTLVDVTIVVGRDYLNR